MDETDNESDGWQRHRIADQTMLVQQEESNVLSWSPNVMKLITYMLEWVFKKRAKQRETNNIQCHKNHSSSGKLNIYCSFHGI